MERDLSLLNLSSQVQQSLTGLCRDVMTRHFLENEERHKGRKAAEDEFEFRRHSESSEVGPCIRNPTILQ
jgi:hypothetical protein